MKRLWSTLLVLVMVLSCLGGLAGASAEGTGEIIKLKWYFPMAPQPDQDKIFEQANEITREAIGIEVEYVPISFGDYNQKMQVIITSGEEFDFCMTSNTRADYYQNVARNAYIPIDELLAEYGTTLLATIPEKVWSATLVNGQRYGVPNYQISCVTNAMWVQTELAEKYGFDIATVSAPRDLEPFFDQVLANETGITPIVYQNSMTNWGYSLIHYGFDELSSRNVPGAVRYSDDSLTVVNQFASEEFAAHLKMMREWYEKGYISPDAATVADATADLNAGKYAAGYHGNGKPGADAELSTRYGYPLESAAISGNIMSTSAVVATMQAISRTSKNPEAVMRFLEYINSPEDTTLYNLLCYGVEGEHYEKIGENKIEVIPGSNYNPGVNWVLGSTFNAYTLKGQPDDVWEVTKELNMNCDESAALGFAFDSTNVTAEIAQCKSAVDEYMASIDSGSVDLEQYLPEFLAKLEASGVDTIIAEMQSQIDAWKASK